MPGEDLHRPTVRNGAGNVALVSGVVAAVFAFVPIVGEFVAAPAALMAIVLGVVGWNRAEKGVATNAREAMTGCVLGLMAALVLVLVLAATAGPR